MPNITNHKRHANATLNKQLSYGLTIRAKTIGGGDPFYLEFWIKLTTLERISDFRPIFARSDSAETPSEKSSILSLIGTPLRAFQ